LIPVLRKFFPVVLAFASLYCRAQDRPDALIITPPKLDFGKRAVDSASAPASVTVRNPSNSTIRFDQIISSGIDFESTHNCGNQLAPRSECAIQVTFKPAISGDRMGAIEIAASDSGSPHFVSLAGRGE
jgi:hypothetical protein